MDDYYNYSIPLEQGQLKCDLKLKQCDYLASVSASQTCRVFSECIIYCKFEMHHGNSGQEGLIEYDSHTVGRFTDHNDLDLETKCGID